MNTPSPRHTSGPLKINQIPGYQEAVDREREIREAVFIHAPEFVCGVEVMPLSLSHLIRLNAAQSPFIKGQIPNAEDCLLFLWMVSPSYDYAIEARSKLPPWNKKADKIVRGVRRDYYKSLKGLSLEPLIDGILKYLDEAFQDSPPSTMKGFTAPYYCNAAALAVSLCEPLNCTVDELVTMPLKIIFQCMKALIQRNNPNAILFNPSDKVRAQWLKQINEGN